MSDIGPVGLFRPTSVWTCRWHHVGKRPGGLCRPTLDCVCVL